jgi:hypothetical protein
MPRFLGEGAFSHAFRTRDGKHVIKRLKPTLLKTSLAYEERVAMASRYVASIRTLRRAGLPVSKARVPERHPHMVVQRFARRGVAFRELGVRARFRALVSAVAISARAWYHLTRAGVRGVFVDPLVQNMRFDRTGRVVEWFDPVAPVSLARWYAVLVHAIVSPDRAPASRRALPRSNGR